MSGDPYSMELVNQTSWNQLVEQSAFPSAFHTYEWVHAYEKSAPFSLTPCHVFLKDNAGEVSAFLPLFLVNGCPRLNDYLHKKVKAKPGFQPPMLLSHSFDGFSGGPVCREESEAVFEPLITALEAKAEETDVDFFGIVNIPEYRKTFIDYLKKSGFFVRNISPTSALDVKWSTFEEYLDSLSAKNQRNLLTFRKKSLNANLTAEVVRGTPDIERVLALLAMTLNKNGHSHDSGAKTSFYRALLENLRDTPEFLLIKNKMGTIITFIMFFRQKGVITAWLAGIDYEYQELAEPYHFAYQELINYAIENQFKRIEIGRGNFEFKRRYGFQPYLLLFAVKTLKEQFRPELDRWSAEIAEGCIQRFNKNVAPKYALNTQAGSSTESL